MPNRALLDLLLANNVELVMEVITNSSPAQSSQERGKLKILRRMRKTSSRIHILKSNTAPFGLFRELLGGIPWEFAESPSSELFPKSSG